MTLSSSSCRYGLSFSRLSSPSLTTEPSEVRTRAGSKGKGRRETQRDRVNLHIQRDALGTNLRDESRPFLLYACGSVRIGMKLENESYARC